MTRARDLSDLGGGITQADLPAEGVNESKLQVSNAPTNGYALTAQSGNTGGMTWAEMAGGLQTLISTTNITSPTSSATVSWSNAGYTGIRIQILDWRVADNNKYIYMRASTNGGTSFLTSGYSVAYLGEHSFESAQGGGANSGSTILVSRYLLGNGADEGAFVDMTILNAASTSQSIKTYHMTASARDSSNRVHSTWNVGRISTGSNDIDAVELIVAGGANLSQATIRVIGIV